MQQYFDLLLEFDVCECLDGNCVSSGIGSYSRNLYLILDPFIFNGLVTFQYLVIYGFDFFGLNSE